MDYFLVSVVVVVEPAGAVVMVEPEGVVIVVAGALDVVVVEVTPVAGAAAGASAGFGASTFTSIFGAGAGTLVVVSLVQATTPVARRAASR